MLKEQFPGMGRVQEEDELPPSRSAEAFGEICI